MRHFSSLHRRRLGSGLAFTASALGLGLWLGPTTTAHAHGAIISASCALHGDNDLRASCPVELTADHIARVGIRVYQSGDPWRWGDYSAADSSHDLEIWNMEANTTYEYQIQIGNPGHGLTSTGTFTTGVLPPNVRDMAFDVVNGSGQVEYVLFNAGCSGERFLILVNAAGAIVWYQEVDLLASSGTGNTLSGFNVSDDGAGHPTILASISQREMVELAFDGSILASDSRASSCSGAAGDLGGCPHHDIVRPSYSDAVLWLSAKIKDVTVPAVGNPYYNVPNVPPNTCTEHFINDGVVRMNASWTADVATMDLMDIPNLADRYKPVADPGPASSYTGPGDPCTSNFYNNSLDYGPDHIDWTHANALFPSNADGNERWYVSLQNWDQIIKYDPSSGTIDWALSPNGGYSDFNISNPLFGPSDFLGQHNISVEGDPTTTGYIQFFDNREDAPAIGDERDSRVLRIGDISLDPNGQMGGATILESFVLRDLDANPMYCSHQGSGVTLPDNEERVLALCNANHTIVELEENDGDIDPGRVPPWILQPSENTCGDLSGFYRAYPLAEIGFD